MLGATDVPKFGWQREHTKNGEAQSKAHVQVRDVERNIVWDSDTVNTRAAQIEYRGPQLRYNNYYYVLCITMMITSK